MTDREQHQPLEEVMNSRLHDLESSAASLSSSSSQRNHFYKEGIAKPFAPSAAKRQSVMTLPSIKYLQHQYAKIGLENLPPLQENIRSDYPLGHLRAVTEGEMQDAQTRKEFHKKKLDIRDGARLLGREQLPPTPTKPGTDRRMPWEQTAASTSSVKAEKELRNQVLAAMNQVCCVWKLYDQVDSTERIIRATADSKISPDSAAEQILLSPSPETSANAAPRPTSPADRTHHEYLLPRLLNATPGLIRAVQKYAASLPEADSIAARNSTRVNYLSISTTSRPRPSVPQIPSNTTEKPTATSAVPSRSTRSALVYTAAPLDGNFPLGEVHKSSLNLLSTINDLSHKYRVKSGIFHSPDPTSPAIETDSLSIVSEEDSLSHTTPSLTNSSETCETPPSAPIYRDDITLDDLFSEAAQVTRYVEMVQNLLDQVAQREKDNKNLWSLPPKADATPKLLRESDATEYESHPVSESFTGTRTISSILEAQKFLCALLSETPKTQLEAAQSRVNVLEMLSDGTLLCYAYNRAVKLSSRPFAFIPASSIHDLTQIGIHAPQSTQPQPNRVGDTFRKVDNLTKWAAAIKLRYSINLTVSVSKSSGSNRKIWDELKFPVFNPKQIGRKESGWQETLELAVLVWANAVVQEKRQDVA